MKNRSDFIDKNRENLKIQIEIFCQKHIVSNVISAFLDHLKPKFFFLVASFLDIWRVISSISRAFLENKDQKKGDVFNRTLSANPRNTTSLVFWKIAPHSHTPYIKLAQQICIKTYKIVDPKHHQKLHRRSLTVP